MLTGCVEDVAPGKVALARTHLEMTAQAPARPVPAPNDITFRALAYEYDAYRALFRRVGEDWLWFGRLTWSDARLSVHFANPDVHLYTLTKNGQDEAILELDFRQDGICDLAYFGLTPALIGLGAGRYLMNHAIRLAWAAPIQRMTLHTCQLDSPQALPFYVRSGFVPIARSVEVDDDPRLTGLLPETAAPHVPLIR